MAPFVIAPVCTPTCASPDIEVVGVGPLVDREVEATDPGLSGNLMEFCNGTVPATTLLLIMVLFTLLSSLDALDIG